MSNVEIIEQMEEKMIKEPRNEVLFQEKGGCGEQEY